MKIKTVCEVTGLTDRAIRHYIEEELVSPHTEETYLGRRIFEFSEGDVSRLRDIAVLRKFGFSILEIRGMLKNPETISQAVAELRERKRLLLQKEGALFERLCDDALESADSVERLAAILCEPVAEEPVPSEDNKDDVGKRIFAVAWRIVSLIPAVLSFCLMVEADFAYGRTNYAYPKTDAFSVIFMLLLFSPSIFLFLPLKRVRKKKKVRVARIIAFCLSILFLPLCSSGFISHSETNDIRNYRRLDADCIANRYLFYQRLFPTWPHTAERDPETKETVYLDARYHYANYPAFDYTYDIYAEWPLRQEEFDKEVARVKALFAEEEHQVIEKEHYTCLVKMSSYSDDKPFERVTASYTFYIFAYDETNLRVRYILCDSLEDGYDQPYYLKLDW